MTIDGRNISANEFLYLYTKNSTDSSSVQTPRAYASLFAVFKMKVFEAESCGIDTLPEFKAELAGYVATIDPSDKLLHQEYRDGMLLFEISNRRVWKKSTSDTDGLAGLFHRQRDRYKWDQPHAKGWVIYTHDDATAHDACAYLDSIGTAAPDLRPVLSSRFGRNLLAVKYLVREGINPIIDALVFNGNVQPELNDGWEVATPYAFRILQQPEEWTDVKGNLTSDYQKILNDLWEQELWSTHKVEFNYDVIDEIDMH